MNLKYNILSLLTLCLAAAGFTACEDGDEVMILEPRLELASRIVRASVGAGTYEVGYRITNPSDEQPTLSVTENEDWMDVAVDEGRIILHIKENPSSRLREAFVSVVCEALGTEDALKVKQEGRETPRITLENDFVEAAGMGGHFAVNYSVENPFEGVEPEVKCTADWISNIEVKAGVIGFDIARNEASEARHAQVVVTYPEAVNSVSFGVVQNPSDAAEEVMHIAIENREMTMILVEGGTFMMGGSAEQEKDAWPDELPAHEVTLSSYYIAQVEVTQDLWQAVMGSNPSDHLGNLEMPVENVSLDDVRAFIAKVNALTGKDFSLPTEAQWEFAARGGNRSEGFLYSGGNVIGEVAWYYENGNLDPHPVGTKKANELGLYDMSGNVWEWCADFYGDYTPDPVTDPKGPETGEFYVIRGGSFNNTPDGCRPSKRSSDKGGANFNVGFRLVLNF